jgi:hypothetical protein
MLRIPNLQDRQRATRILIDTNESWARAEGNLFGVSTRQLEALESQAIAFEWVSKAPSNA